jgi:hypothetical protein
MLSIMLLETFLTCKIINIVKYYVAYNIAMWKARDSYN